MYALGREDGSFRQNKEDVQSEEQVGFSMGSELGSIWISLL